ncbi:DUF4241 domain-containing protein [Streptomyces sp. NPDC058548]|uniref:DUF4241 domain-containing protein n=1 Tax=Streptomyces sp. NPDC058548 TaxID=3346545 RepID=UPI0036670FF3
MTSTPPDCTRWFTPGAAVAPGGGGGAAFTVTELGELGLPTGRLVACDPVVHLGDDDERPAPFTVTVPPGSYPVQAVVADVEHPFRNRVIAAARLVVRDTPAVRWEPALVPGQELAELADGDFFGYGVDAGVGCFLDASAHHAFPGTQDEEGVVWEAMDSAPPGPTAFLAEGVDGHTVAVFGSGWGDGCYPTWIGRAADGGAVCFVTDFRVFRFAPA